jgi:hypothetical protein
MVGQVQLVDKLHRLKFKWYDAVDKHCKLMNNAKKEVHSKSVDYFSSIP